MTLVVNLAGAPGAGKSTMAAGLFHRLKTDGYECEMAREYAKDVVWEGRSYLLGQQLYILAKQLKKLRDLQGKVDIIITDSPLPLMLYYRKLDPTLSNSFDTLLVEQYNSFNNYLVYVDRVKPYVSAGRVGDEEDSKQIAEEALRVMKSYDIPPDLYVDGSEEGLFTVVRKVKMLVKGIDRS